MQALSATWVFGILLFVSLRSLGVASGADQPFSPKGHWAYIKPERPPLPRVQTTSWPQTPIDYFILARLEKEGLHPSDEADKITLIRRLSLDLTGLPPTPKEVDDFLADQSPASFERLVDRLLASPHYGERMALTWLDLARYADSNGYHADGPREMWKWREWVIDAFNRNVPFDQFTIQQLAGDMLPDASLEQRIASGFNRNAMVNFEGGADENEYLIKYVIDRVDTTATVFLGTTMACAECHDHKHDPITQKEFYQFYAFFNNVPEKGIDGFNTADTIGFITPAPILVAPSPEQKLRLEQFQKEIAGQLAQLERMLGPDSVLDAAQAQWEQRLRKIVRSNWTVLAPAEFSSTGGATLRKLEDQSVLATGANPDQDVYEITLKTELSGMTGVRLEALTDDSLPLKGASRSHTGNFLLTGFEVDAERLDPAQEHPPEEPPAFGAWYALGPFQGASAAEAYSKSFIPETEIDLGTTYGSAKLSWSERADWRDGQVQMLGDKNAATYLYRTIQVKRARPMMVSLGSGGGMQLWLNGKKLLAKNVMRAAAPDQEKLVVQLTTGENKLLAKINSGSAGQGFYFAASTNPVTKYEVQFASAVADYNQKDHAPRAALDGKPETGWAVDGNLENNRVPRQALFIASQPIGFDTGTILRVRLKFQSTSKQHVIGRFRFAVTATSGADEFAALPDPLQVLLFSEDDRLTAQNKKELTKYYRETFSPEAQATQRKLEGLRDEFRRFEATIPVTMVMEEMKTPRETHVLIRGNFQNRGEKVTAGVPERLHPFPEGLAPNRLGLAQWLVDPNHPLVSRVLVNRFWQQTFGVGLVKTSNDFGSQGERPSHPELLDWLAREFVRLEWDVKAFLKLIVLSATYRQSSVLSPVLLEHDPENRLLARGARTRLDAELIRDNALAISGLLSRQLGGASVYPYQPPGMWDAAFAPGVKNAIYVQSKGEDSFRRGIYTHWKRKVPYPSFLAFDAPDRQVCTCKRPRTNTPLQALVLMNDPVYIEAARALAQRMMREGGPATNERLVYGFRLCLARPPQKRELDILFRIFVREREMFRQNKNAAELLVGVGVSPTPVDLDLSELAAWTTIGNILFTLDETITKS